jgi:hypothetical protein
MKKKNMIMISIIFLVILISNLEWGLPINVKNNQIVMLKILQKIQLLKLQRQKNKEKNVKRRN